MTDRTIAIEFNDSGSDMKLIQGNSENKSYPVTISGIAVVNFAEQRN